MADVNGFYSSYMTGRPGDCLPLFPSAARLIRIAKGAEQVNPKISTKNTFYLYGPIIGLCPGPGDPFPGHLERRLHCV